MAALTTEQIDLLDCAREGPQRLLRDAPVDEEFLELPEALRAKKS